MTEKKRSFDFTLGKTKRISLLSGTQEIFQYTPETDADVIVNVSVTETTNS